MRTGLYPGTFDPITLGHMDVIKRACTLVDRLFIGVAINRDKGPLFTLEERVAMVEHECDITTVFLMAEADRQPIASKLVKEIARLQGDIAPFVTPAVRDALYEKYPRQPRG